MGQPLLQDQSAHEHRRLVIYSSAIAVALIAGILIYVNTQKQTGPAGGASASPIAVTPEHYTDFYGVIESVDPKALVVQATITNAKGENLKKDYTVQVTDETKLQRMLTGGQTSEIAIGDLSIGEVIQAFGVENLATVSSFTASRIVLVQNES